MDHAGTAEVDLIVEPADAQTILMGYNLGGGALHDITYEVIAIGNTLRTNVYIAGGQSISVDADIRPIVTKAIELARLEAEVR